MVKGKPPQVKTVSPTVIITGKTAYVLCYDDLGEAIMVATNIFTLENGAWRIIHHHASQPERGLSSLLHQGDDVRRTTAVLSPPHRL